MVCMKQPKLSDNDVVVDFVYWLVHGTSIFRAIPELVRPEYPDERATRETKTGGVLQSVEEVLARTRGVVNFYDLSEDEKGPALFEVNVLKQEPPIKMQRTEGTAENPGAAESSTQQTSESTATDPSDQPKTETDNQPDVDMDKASDKPKQDETATASTKTQSKPGVTPRHRLRSKKTNAATAAQDEAIAQRGVVRSRQEVEQLAQQSLDDSRKLDGLPPKRLKLDWTTLSELVNAVPVNTDDGDAAEESLFCDLGEDDGMIEVTSDDEVIYFLQVKKKTVVEARLTKEEKQKFDRAKDECLAPWIENFAWEAADQSEVAEGEDCPLRFLLTWKLVDGKWGAKARVILQGFKHKTWSQVKSARKARRFPD